MKEILIIGGSYFLGRVFVEELLKQKETTITVVNRGNIPIRKESVREIVCDRHDLDKLERSLPHTPWDAVIDFCAYVPDDISGTLEVLRANRPGQYIFISTASVYAPTEKIPVGEDAPLITGPQPELGPFAGYAWDKRRAEEELSRRCGDLGLPCTVIRPAFIYGKYNYAPRENYFFDLIEKDEQISYPMLAEVLSRVTQKTFTVRYVSMQEIEEQSIPLPFPLEENLVYDGTRVKDVLGFSYTPFEEGMRETYRFYRIGRGKSWPP